MSWWRRLLGGREPDRRVQRSVPIDQLARFRGRDVSFRIDPGDPQRVIAHGLPEDIDAILAPPKEKGE